MPGAAFVSASGFVAGVVALGRYLRSRETDGSLDAGPSSASSPGLRRLFDFGPGGWSEDGVGQRPLRRR
ncbi:hypothetical protein BH24ACT15_BH24ACT15_21650 [soil metagenome]